MKLIKDIIKGILLSPLNAIMILLALVHILVDAVIKRYKKVKNDLKSAPRVLIRKIVVKWQYRN